MPYIAYREKRFNTLAAGIIAHANLILDEYAAQGFILTLRQLYYKFVARGLLPQKWRDPKTGSTNNERAYKNLGNIINEGRLAGEIDWDAIEDRTRNVQSPAHWTSPANMVGMCAAGYAIDKWVGQKHRPQIWIEKDALVGVIAGVCQELDISYFSCRGYTSQSEMWRAAQKIETCIVEDDQVPVIIHLGDHDPSGMDMTRDVMKRMSMFLRTEYPIRRIALNINQIRKYNPPPSPAKVTDSRYPAYVDDFGDDCWELDALEPAVIIELIRAEVAKYRDESLWAERLAIEQTGRERLEVLAKREAKYKPRKKKSNGKRNRPES